MIADSPWGDADVITDNLESIGFEGVKVSKLDFEIAERDIVGFLELMRLLLGKVLEGENGERYEKLIKGKAERGDMRMRWQALVVSAQRG